MKKSILFLGSFSLLLSITSCKKDDDNPAPQTDIDSGIITGFAGNLVSPSYTHLAQETSTLRTNILAFQSAPSATALENCRNSWKSAREVWEKTEAFLFGPVATENIDPRIDTWPVNFNDLEIVMNSGDPLTETYINTLDDALKGFHPIEYLLYGEDGNKTYLDFTARELEYLDGLSLNLKTLTGQLATGWNTANATSYYYAFTLAGNGSPVYSTKRLALEEVVNAMAGICDEVANGKIYEPFIAMNPELEESPFSGNSITDFTNNMRGVQNAYLGKYVVDGYGLEDLVKQHNLALDGELKLKMNNAIGALNNITDPFGTAITTQPVQVQNAIDAINELKDVIETDLLPLVQLHVH